MDEESKPNRDQIVSNLIDRLGDQKPTDPVLVTSYIIREAMRPHIEEEIGSGFGFGEADVDFVIDGEVVRVVVKPVPEMTKLRSERRRQENG